MEGGLLSLKWNDHSHTFFDMLSTIRRKESYCDVTLISDGRYYKVHKLVLSTCSDFFDNLFSRTDCKHPVVIIANVSYKDLEALLNYMYLGEVNVLQTELANLMKAAEVLRIKGLAEPTKAPTKETRDNRRSTYSEVVDSSSKRKRLEDSGNPSAKRSSPLVVLDRPDSVESGRSRVACDPLATTDVVPTSSKGPSTREAHREPGISSQEDDWDQESNEKAVRPEVKVEDPISIKDEPGNSNWYSDPTNDEGGDSLHYNEADTSLEYNAQSMDYSGSCLPWELSAATQSHPVEGHLPQGMPGASGMQGMIDLGVRSSIVQLERYRMYDATKRTRNFVESWRIEFPWVNYNAERREMTCTTCIRYCQEEDKSRFISGNTNFKRLALVRHDLSLVHQRCQARKEAELAAFASPLMMAFSVDKCEVELKEAQN